MRNLTDELVGQALASPAAGPHAELLRWVRHLHDLTGGHQELMGVDALCTTIFGRRHFRSFEERHTHDKLRYQMLDFVAGRLRDRDVDPARRDLLKRFVTQCQSPGEAVVSFNHDLLLENRILRGEMAGRIDYGIPLRSYPDTFARNENGPRLRLIKPHGSLNWMMPKGSTSPDAEILRVDPGEEAAAWHRGDVPVFVPMSHARQTFDHGNLYSTLWAIALHLLETASDIVYLGYGFGMTDLPLLPALLESRDRVTRVVLLEPGGDASPSLRRAAALFGAHRVANEDACNFLERELGSEGSRPHPLTQ